MPDLWIRTLTAAVERQALAAGLPAVEFYHQGVGQELLQARAAQGLLALSTSPEEEEEGKDAVDRSQRQQRGLVASSIGGSNDRRALEASPAAVLQPTSQRAKA